MTPEDHAQEQELAFWQAVQAAAIQPPATRPSAEYCQADDCGAPIPEGRRRVLPGVQHCIECAERQARENKIRGWQ